MAENRLDDLEATLAFQAQSLDELNEVIVKQWGEIDALKLELTRLRARLVAMEQAMPDTADETDTPPPHY